MSSVSIGGVGSGYDFSSLIAQLVTVKQQPITQLTQSQTALQAKLTDYGSVDIKLQALQAAANSLALPAAFDQASASVSNPTSMTASAATTALPGSYLVQVQQLAQSNQITNMAATVVASPTTSIVSGASATFTFHAGSEPDQTVTLGAASTINDLATGINNLSAGVTASVVNTGSDTTPAYRLILTASTSGASNGVTVVADGTTLDFTNSTGTGGVDTLQAGQDAIAILGDPTQHPVTLQRSSNVITDGIPGVTLSLSQTTPSPVTVNVTPNNSAVAANIQTFVSDYNDLVTFVNHETAYNVTTKTGGTLYDEAAAKGIVSQIQRTLSSTVSGLTPYGAVGQIGFQTNQDGTITVDSTALNAALTTNYQAVKSLFSNQGAAPGVAQQVSQIIDSIDNVVSGSLTMRENDLTSQISSLTNDITTKQADLATYQAQLNIQFAQLDGLLSSMQGQQSYLTALGQQSSTSTGTSTTGA